MPAPRYRAKIRICLTCGAYRYHRTRGLCGHCYSRWSWCIAKGLSWELIVSRGLAQPTVREARLHRTQLCDEAIL